MNARAVMSTPAVVCREEAFLEEVAEILAERSFSGMPVVDRGGHLVGVVSERDLAHVFGNSLVRLAVARPHHPKTPHNSTRIADHPLRVKDIMTTPPIVATLETPLRELARVMWRENVNRLPVVDDGIVVGVVTRSDVLHSIADAPTRSPRIEAPVVRGCDMLDGANG
jgi:CBS domain-containing protein